MAEPKEVKYQAPDKPGEWQTGTLASPVETIHEVLQTRHEADVRDDDGLLIEDVTVIQPDKK